MKARRRRRKGFDEERKRELRKDLERYFTLSKNLSVRDDNPYGNLANLQDEQLEQAQQFGHNFGDVSVFPEESQDREEEEDRDREKKTRKESKKKAKKDREKTSNQDNEKAFNFATGNWLDNDNETPYSKLALEQIQDQEEDRTEELYTQQIQYLVDLPGALESANQGHIIRPFHEPFLALEELLVMSERENPSLNAIQRLWLVWGKWETYYTAWHSVMRDDKRQLPGKGRDAWDDCYQERGIHELETTHLESTILRVMRREIIRKSEEERKYIDVPTPLQLHCFFLGLRRQDWDATSWQIVTPNGAVSKLQLEDDYSDYGDYEDRDDDDDDDDDDD